MSTIGPSPLKILVQVAIAGVVVTAGAEVLIQFLGRLGQVWLLLNESAIISSTAILMACATIIAPIAAAALHRPRVEITAEGFTAQGLIGPPYPPLGTSHR